MKKYNPTFILTALSIITINLWVMSKNDFGQVLHDPLKAVSQISALLGLIFMSVNLVLTTRLRWLEKLFGGLDSVYYSHQILGALSFLLVLNHPLLLAVSALPNTVIAKLYLLPSGDLAYSLGVFGVYAMIASFIFMLFIKLPYHIWKITHQALGLAFLLGGVHSLLIPSDTAIYLPLRIWVGFFVFSGIGSWLYMTFFYRSLGPKYLYEVSRVKRALDVFNIYFKPLAIKKLAFDSGQFVYVEFENDKIGNEIHPFSISSSPGEPEVRVSVKMIGDYTLKLANIQAGNRVFLYGPYGTFGKVLENKNVVWISGGIGITPFLNMLKREAQNPRHRAITFYNAYSSPDEAIFNSEINEVKSNIPHLNYVDWCTGVKKRLTARTINEISPLEYVDAVFCCGPQPMMEGLKTQLLSIGFPEDKFIYENFTFDP